MIRLCILVILALRAGYVQAQSNKGCVPRRYNTSSARVEGKINVHLIPHSHDDTGWLKTVDQYYYGSRQDIQVAGVQYVLDTVVYALLANPDRKFSYAEMAFFTRWWEEQSEEHQDSVKKLVANGQLQFINGGWVQHDEAAAHYVAMIDQTTRGHRFLNETFGFRPRVGWQIDPFGHSSTQASLLSGFLGFDGLFFGRSDYQDLARRKKLRELEIVWRGARSFGEEADVFLGTFPSGNYGPPAGFYFDWGNWDPPVQDNVCLVEYNLEQRVEDFVKAAQEMAEMYDDNDVFWPMGTDFTYSNAFTWFKNMDKLIHYVNLDGRVNAFYSTPEAYVDAKHSFNASWPLKTDDFFPYADCAVCMWTGYFASRAASKGYIKASTSYLQAARQLELLTNTSGYTDHLEEAAALLQHHDSITGTEKQHVANDYHARLAAGWAHTERFVSKALSHLVYNTKPSLAAERASRAHTLQEPEAHDRLLLLHQCPQLNVSVCEISLKLSAKEEPFLVAVYNPLGWQRKAPVRVPAASNGSAVWSVQDHEGRDIESQLVPVSRSTLELQRVLHENGALPKLAHAASDELVFIADLPPLGYATYKVSKSVTPSDDTRSVAFVSDRVDWSDRPEWTADANAGDRIRISNGGLHAEYCPRSGRMTSLKTREGTAVDMKLTGAWYNSSDGGGPGEQGPASGAYIFRPNGIFIATGPVPTTSIHGPVVTEVHQTLLEFLTVTTRFWRDFDFAEVEWTAGPIPIADSMGKEVVIRYETNLSSGDTFLTDANGRELLERKLNFRETWELNVTQPVAGNYYPITAAIAIQDADVGELSVLTDRAQGGTSLTSGTIETMVHRRTLLDDIRGVNEPLNETVAGCRFCDSPGLVVRGTHFLALEKPGKAAAQRRRLQQLINDPVLVAFGPFPRAAAADGSTAPLQGRFSALSRSLKGLPPNVHLLTTKVLEDGRLLLRLAHLFQVDEDAGKLAEKASVDLNALFQDFKFESADELGLAGAQPLKLIRRLEWKAGHPIGPKAKASATALPAAFRRGPELQCQSDCAEKSLEVELSPMEIRTFVLTPISTENKRGTAAAVETS